MSALLKYGFTKPTHTPNVILTEETGNIMINKAIVGVMHYRFCTALCPFFSHLFLLTLLAQAQCWEGGRLMALNPVLNGPQSTDCETVFVKLSFLNCLY